MKKKRGNKLYLKGFAIKQKFGRKSLCFTNIFLFGFLLILALFFWYKTFAYYNHDIHSYDIEELTELSSPLSSGATQKGVYSIARLRSSYRTEISNQSSFPISVTVYQGSDDFPIQGNLLIGSGERYDFDSPAYSYRIVVYGKDMTEDNVIIKASTLFYLQKYRLSVIITMVIGIVMTCLWGFLTLCIPGITRRIGSGVNMAMAVLCAAGCVFMTLLYHKGYYESNLCFFTLLFAVFAMVMEERRDGVEWKRSMVSMDESFFVAGTVSLTVSSYLFSLMLNSREGSLLYFFNAANKMSIPDYIITVLLFLVLFLIFSFVFMKQRAAAVVLRHRVSGKSFKICFPAVLTCFYIQQEELQFVEHPEYLILMVFLGGSILFLISREHLSLFPQQNYNIFTRGCGLFVAITYLFTIGISFVSTTVINFFYWGSETDNIVMHLDCYFRPVYYAINHLMPPINLKEYYGHYSLFYAAFMKLVGTNMFTAGILTGIAGGLTALLAVGIVQKLTKSFTLRIIGSFSVMNILCSQLYIAIVPHRLIFPMLLLFFIVRWGNKKIGWQQIMFGLIISLLAILWNTETGIVVLMVWMVFLLLKKVSGKEHCIVYASKIVAVAVAGILIGMAVIVGVFILLIPHNLRVSLTESLSGFLGALGDAGYMFSEQFNFIRWTNAPWVYIMMLFLFACAFGISRMGFLGPDRDQALEMPVIISIALMGLGLMVYFISRPEDYSIIMLPAIFLMLYGAEKTKSVLQNINSASYLKKALFLIACFSLCSILARTQDTLKNVYCRVMENRQLDYSLLQEDMDSFAREVPEGSLFQGHGLAEIYLELGWQELPYEDTKYLITSSATINLEEYMFVKEVYVGDKKYFLYKRF